MNHKIKAFQNVIWNFDVQRSSARTLQQKYWIGVSMIMAEGEVGFVKWLTMLRTRRFFCSFFLDLCLMDWPTASILEVSGSNFKASSKPLGVMRRQHSMCTTLEGTSDVSR